MQGNLLSFLENDFNNQMNENMDEINQAENRIDEERAAIKADVDAIEVQEKSIRDELFALEKKLRQKEIEFKGVKRDGERKIEAVQDQIE